MQAKWPLTHEWTKVLCHTHVHSRIVLSHTRNERMPVKHPNGPGDYHTKWSKPDKDTYHMILLICACVQSRFNHVQLFVTPWTIAFQSPLSVGILQAEYWTGLPFLPPGGLPDSGIKSVSPVAPGLQADSLPLSLWGSPWHWLYVESKKKKNDTN